MDTLDESEGKIDPTFFSTCRLCVSKPGSYQILPQIQKQIKELFDISVDAYDGLPQLLCEECRKTITRIYAIRKTFQMKQEELISKHRVLHASEDVESDAKYPEEKVDTKGPFKGSLLEVEKPSVKIAAPSPKSKLDRSLAQPIKTSHESQVTSSEFGLKSEGRAKLKRKLKPPERSRWVKRYACRFCDRKFRRFTSLNDHLQAHSALVEAQSKFNVRHCLVSLPRCGPPKCEPGGTQKPVDESICTAPGVQVENVFGNYFIRTQLRTTEEIKPTCDDMLRPQRKYYYDLDPDDPFKPEKKRRIAKTLGAANKANVEHEPKEHTKNPVDEMSGTAVTNKNTVEPDPDDRSKPEKKRQYAKILGGVKIATVKSVPKADIDRRVDKRGGTAVTDKNTVETDPDDRFKPEKKQRIAKIITLPNKATVESEPNDRNEKQIEEMGVATLPNRDIIVSAPKIKENITIEQRAPATYDSPIVESSSCYEFNSSSVTVSEKQYVSSNNNIIPAQGTYKALQCPFINCSQKIIPAQETDKTLQRPLIKCNNNIIPAQETDEALQHPVIKVNNNIIPAQETDEALPRPFIQCNNNIIPAQETDTAYQRRFINFNNNITPAQETEKALQRPFIKCVPTVSLLTTETATIATTPSPLNVLSMKLQSERILLIDDPTSISLKGSRALAIYDLYLTPHSPKMVITLFVSVCQSNVFCIDAVDARGRLSIFKEPPVHQLKILKSLLDSYVINTIKNMSIHISQNVYSNTMRFLSITKYILEKGFGLYGH